MDCCKDIHVGWSVRKCSRKGIIERDGKFYCKQHDPVAVAEKARIVQEKFNKEYEERERVDKLARAAPELLEALKAITNYPDVQIHVGTQVHDRCKAAIKKATE